MNCLTVEGFNYWDGHNWSSVIVSADSDTELLYEVLEDKALIKELNEAIENSDFVKKENGQVVYEYDK